MQETLKHKEVFEYYYALGAKRSFTLVESKYKVSNTSISRWSKAFNWQKRIEQRDFENGKKIVAKTDKAIVHTKAEYRQEIKVQLGILKAILNNIIKNFKDEQMINVMTSDGLRNIINSYEKLCKLDLLLMGEATDRSKLDLDWERITDEQLDRFIEILGKGGKIPMPSGEEEKRD